MAYARLGKDSDVYVIKLHSRHLECVGCSLAPCTLDAKRKTWSHPLFVTTDARRMRLHLKLHRSVGEKVPSSAMKRLKAEAAKDEKFNEAAIASFLATAQKAQTK